MVTLVRQYYHGLVLGGGKPGHDMWKNNAPASDDIASITYTANYFTSAAVTVIDEFTAEMTARSNTTNASSRLFLFFPIQNVHSPYQLPPAWETKSFPKFPFSTYAQMLHLLDNAVENVTVALQRNHLFENTLIIFSADSEFGDLIVYTTLTRSSVHKIWLFCLCHRRWHRFIWEQLSFKRYDCVASSCIFSTHWILYLLVARRRRTQTRSVGGWNSGYGIHRWWIHSGKPAWYSFWS